MTRYYGRRKSWKWGKKEWRKKHIKDRQKLSFLFVGIFEEVQKVFFELDKNLLENLFSKYGNIYGKNAEKYARKTYKKWQDGTTILSGQTGERLLNLIPEYVNYQVRYEWIKKIRKYYLPYKHKFITANINEWEKKLIPAINELIYITKNFELPNELVQKAVWLANGDSKKANEILSSIELEETQIVTNYINAEFKRIQAFIDNMVNTDIEHKILLPQGQITIKIEKESILYKEYNSILDLFGDILGGFMEEKKKDLISISEEELKNALINKQKQGSFLDIQLKDLTEKQKNQLIEKVIEEKFKLDVKQATADQKYINSTRDMGETLAAAAELENNSKSDYNIKSSFETATGKTDIYIKRDNNNVIIAIAIAIAVIVFLFAQ